MLYIYEYTNHVIRLSTVDIRIKHCRFSQCLDLMEFNLQSTVWITRILNYVGLGRISNTYVCSLHFSPSLSLFLSHSLSPPTPLPFRSLSRSIALYIVLFLTCAFKLIEFPVICDWLILPYSLKCKTEKHWYTTLNTTCRKLKITKHWNNKPKVIFWGKSIWSADAQCPEALDETSTFSTWECHLASNCLWPILLSLGGLNAWIAFFTPFYWRAHQRAIT